MDNLFYLLFHIDNGKIWEYVGNNNIHFLSIITLQVRYKDMENEVIVFKNGELELEVNVSDDREIVWLSKQQMAELFQRDRTVISKHLKNILMRANCWKIKTR